MPEFTILQMIREERTRQDAQWGGMDHDDTHCASEWVGYIDKQLERVRGYKNGREVPFIFTMVKVAALAIAAAESHYRVSGSPLEWPDSWFEGSSKEDVGL